MDSPQSFRGAFNGFNREDVVNYISYISTKHETQVNELRSEAQELRTQLAEQENLVQSARVLASDISELRGKTEAQKAELESAQSELAAKEEQIDQLKKEVADRDAELEKLRQELENARAAAAVQPKKTEPASRWTEELNAYRRAESAERRARERVNQMYDQANGALAEASVRVEKTAEQIAEMVMKVESDLELLRQAMAESENTLADTAVVLGAIRPDMD